jgi:hypothetical protein
LVYITLATLVAMRDLRDAAALILLSGYGSKNRRANGGGGGDGDFRKGP